MGRTWVESFQKALRGMEAGLDGWSLPRGYKRLPKDQLEYNLRVPNPDRMMQLKQVCGGTVARGQEGRGCSSVYGSVVQSTVDCVGSSRWLDHVLDMCRM